MTLESAPSGARRARPRRGTPPRALDVELGTTGLPRLARRPPLERGGKHSLSGQPALNLVARFRPGHARTTRYGRPGTSLDLLDPLALAAPLTGEVGFQGRQQLGHNPGPLLGRELERFAKQPISSTRHRCILLRDRLDEEGGGGQRPPVLLGLGGPWRRWPLPGLRCAPVGGPCVVAQARRRGRRGGEPKALFDSAELAAESPGADADKEARKGDQREEVRI